MHTTIYGIKNCDTMKKAFAWLNERGIAYHFHDYKKSGADEAVLRAAIDQLGWEQVLNRRGTTWRKLPDDVKAGMNAECAIETALANPSVIKRPLLVVDGEHYPGFDPETYSKILG